MMQGGGSRYSAAGGAGFTEEFQEAHYHQLHKVADAYTGKMGLGSGRSSDPWEDSRPSFSSPTPLPSFSSSSTTTTTTFSSSLPDVVTEEKAKKAKKKRRRHETSSRNCCRKTKKE